jgi:hypothetical protein
MLRVAVDARTAPLCPVRSVHGPVGAGAVCQRIVTGDSVVDGRVNDAVKVAVWPSRTVCAAGRTARCGPAPSVSAEGGAAVVL